MEKALTAWEILSRDEETRQRYEARQKGLHDYATAIETATRQGGQQGRAEGEHRKAREFAQYLLTHGTAIGKRSVPRGCP